jgi:hypothetical protein
MGLALLDVFHVAVIFSQDQDLAEAASDVRDISVSSRRWMRVACAFRGPPPFDRTCVRL